MRNLKSVALFLIPVILLLIFCAALFLRFTPYGVGLVSDSVNYINGARSIAAGNGYFRESGGGTLKPITNFPPLYSILLSIPMFFRMDGIQAANGFSLVFFLINLILIILLVSRSGGNRWIGLICAMIFACLQPFVYSQIFAMSEPLFFACVLSAFLFFYEGWTKKSGRSFFLCGVCCGCATLTRYVGVVSLCAFFISLIFFYPASKKKAGLCLLGGSLPLIFAWLGRNVLVSGNAANRQALIHPVSAEEWGHGALIFWRWLWSERYASLNAPTAWMKGALIATFLFGAIFLFGVAIQSIRKGAFLSGSAALLWAYGIYIYGYLLMIYLTISFLDASVNFEERILFPAFMVFLLIFFTLLGKCAAKKKRLPTAIGLTLSLLMILSFVPTTLKSLSDFSRDGYGWAWQGWKESSAMQLVQQLPPETEIYCNQPEAISLYAGRGAYALLDPIDPSSELPREGYARAMETVRARVRDGQAVLIFFQAQSWLGETSDNWVSQLCDGLPVIYKDESEWFIGKPELIARQN